MDSETDNRARLTCARAAKGDPEELKELLNMLALWPGQEHLRRAPLYVQTFGGEDKRGKAERKKRGSR